MDGYNAIIESGFIDADDEKYNDNNTDRYSNYPIKEYAEQAQKIKEFNDKLLAFKWCYDRDYKPVFSGDYNNCAYYIYYDSEYKASRWWGIDHSGETIDFINAVLEDEDLLLRCLFSDDSVVYTGNDNCDSEDYLDTCFIGNEYYWGDGGKKLNPYHDSENFDYFIKGN